MRYLLLVCLLLTACGTPRHRLDGTWESPLGTLTINVGEQRFDFAGMGNTTESELVIVSESGNTTVAEIDGKTNTLTLNDAGELMVVQEGRTPIVFTRAP